MRIAEAFSDARAEGRLALVPFLVAGFPDMTGFAHAFEDTAAAADVLEIGVPFSDPLADGPVIAQAARQALRGGMRMADLFDFLASRRTQSPPVVLMLSIQQVLACGASFLPRCHEAGVAGLIVPDLPFEEAADLRARATGAGIELVGMVAPTTPAERAREIARQARGFLYVMGFRGVTGSGEPDQEEIRTLAQTLRETAGVPLCAGFGISRPEQIEALQGAVDGVIVGSALVKRIGEGLDPTLYLKELRAAL